MSAGRRILVVEDEPAIADALIYALSTEGFAVEWRATGRDARTVLESGGVALIVLDVGLPDGNGFDWCREIRGRWTTPVLFLTARNAEIDRVVGLEIGGDDYVTKPFSPREVAARVKAILRRVGADGAGAGATAGEAVATREEVGGSGGESGGFAHDAERCEVRYGGVRLELTRYEYRLLAVMLARPGRVFSREVLMAQAWEDPGASLDRTVDAHVKTLRAKLRAVAPEREPIRTHRGLGYSLACDDR